MRLSFAKELAKGARRIVYPSFDEVMATDDPLLEYAQMHHNFREMFPSVDFEADAQIYSESLEANRRYVSGHLDALHRELRKEGALPPKTELPREFIPGLLDEALDAYEAQDIRTHNVVPGSSQLTSYGLRRLERVRRFKEHHADIALYSLNYDECKAMLDHWRTRPPRNDGKPTSRDNSRHHVGELMRFFRWLDSSSGFRWVMPRGLERVERKIPKTEGERRLSARMKDIYTVEELAVLNSHATPFDRLTLYVGLNCAMGMRNWVASRSATSFSIIRTNTPEGFTSSRRTLTRSFAAFAPRRASSGNGCSGVKPWRCSAGASSDQRR